MLSKIAIIATTLILLGVSTCKKLPYSNDFGFKNSAQANSPELPVMLNGRICKDMDDRVGLCAKRVRSDQTIEIDIDERPYAYTLNIVCSSGIVLPARFDVPKDAPLHLEIGPDARSDLIQFTCNLEIIPKDRVNVSAFVHIRFIIVDSEYSERETIYHTRGHLVLGSHARFSRVCTPKRCRNLEEKTLVEAPEKSSAYSESYAMRYNHYGL